MYRPVYKLLDPPIRSNQANRRLFRLTQGRYLAYCVCSLSVLRCCETSCLVCQWRVPLPTSYVAAIFVGATFGSVMLSGVCCFLLLSVCCGGILYCITEEDVCVRITMLL